jgi:hypothetical protein
LTLAGTSWPRNLTTGSTSVQVSPAGGHNAFPGVTVCADGSLLAVWRKAAAHGWAPGSQTLAARSIDQGRTWSAPWVIYCQPDQDTGFGMLTTLSDGRIACIGQVRSSGPATAGAWCGVMFSSDQGETFGPVIPVPFTFTSWAYAAGNLTELDDGTLLALGYGQDTGATITTTRLMRSTDGGYSWHTETTVMDDGARPFNEGIIDRCPDGRLMALVRCEETGFRRIFRTYSTDDGLTWSTRQPIVTGWGRPAWLPLSTGAVVMTYRREGDRSHMYRTSWDNGATWVTAQTLAGVTPSQSVYTQLVEVEPGVVGVIYADEANSGATADVRFKYLLDGHGFSPFGDLAPDTGYITTGLVPAPGWSLAPVSGYEGLAYRINAGGITVSGIATKAAYGPNEAIATLPRDLAPDRVIWQGDHRVTQDGAVRVVNAGTTNTVVHLTWPL